LLCSFVHPYSFLAISVSFLVFLLSSLNSSLKGLFATLLFPVLRMGYWKKAKTIISRFETLFSERLFSRRLGWIGVELMYKAYVYNIVLMH